MEIDQRPQCPGCSVFLQEPWIHCAECVNPAFDLCLHCFARGLEIGSHQSNHKYEIIKNDFQLFERGWTAAEEMRLLSAVSEFGIDNWADIAQQMRSKSKEQCQAHYQRCYLENPQPPLPVLELRDQHYFPNPIPFRVSEDPPRPAENSTLQVEMSGYNAARGDFATEHDNFAECNVREIEFYDCEGDFERSLKLAVVDIYNKSLRERHRRKKIIRDYGLIHVRKHLVYNRRYERDVGIRLEDNLAKFCRLLPPEEWEQFLEGLRYVQEYRNRINRLKEYRHNGIRFLRCGQLYDQLKERRKQAQSQRLGLMDQIAAHIKDERACAAWFSKHKVMENLAKGRPLPLPNETRRSAPPLDIMGMPGYDKLSDEERKLCSTARIIPISFLEFKQILIKEASINGQLKLAQARTLIKIDVNKTRKIFDYLVQHGYINKG